MSRPARGRADRRGARGRTATSPLRPSIDPRRGRRRARRRFEQGIARTGAGHCSARRRRDASPSDRRDLDYLRVFVSQARAGRAGRSAISTSRRNPVLGHARPPRRRRLARRSPTSCSSSATASACLTDRANFPAVRKFFGDSIKGTAEFSYISIGLGMALGFLVGAIQLPVPGVGKLAIGLAGVLVWRLSSASCVAPAA